MQKIEGAVFKRSGVKIIDTYHVTIEHCRFTGCEIGVELVNDNYWTESTVLQNCNFGWCSKAIAFTNLSSHPSFAQSKMHNIDIVGCNIGIEVNSNCSVIRSSFLNITIWLSGTKIGWKLNGHLNKTLITTSFDAGQGGGIGFQLGDKFADGDLPLIICSPGGISKLVENPHNKKFRIVTLNGRIHLYPTNTFRDVLSVYNEAENVVSFRLNSSNRLSISSKKPIVFWDSSKTKRAKILVGSIKSSEDLEVQTPEHGLILRDRVSGRKYRLKIENGKLDVEEV
jgi:hypothetical protein